MSTRIQAVVHLELESTLGVVRLGSESTSSCKLAVVRLQCEFAQLPHLFFHFFLFARLL